MWCIIQIMRRKQPGWQSRPSLPLWAAGLTVLVGALLLPSQVVASSENRNDGRDRPSEGRVSNQVEDVNLNGYDNLLRASTGGRALLEISCPSFTTSTVPAEDGTWQFTGVPDETCTLTATGPGYLTARGTLTVGSADVNVPANSYFLICFAIYKSKDVMFFV